MVAVAAIETVDQVDRLAQATQLQLTWWRFKRHKLALISLFVVALFFQNGLGLSPLQSGLSTFPEALSLVRPGGTVGLLWNLRDENESWVAAL